VSEDDITGRLAPKARLAAEPQAELVATVADRRARFHDTVLRLRELNSTSKN
jgi:hypothetical protein